jgi:hypothetical protein
MSAPARRDGEGPPPEAPAASSAPAASAGAKQDVVVLGPPTADGGGVHVLRARDERLEAGELRTLQEGKPIAGEVVSLAPRPGRPRICDVTASYSPKANRGKGPPKVASSAYRAGWDEIFGARDAADTPRDLN